MEPDEAVTRNRSHTVGHEVSAAQRKGRTGDIAPGPVLAVAAKEPEKSPMDSSVSQGSGVAVSQRQSGSVRVDSLFAFRPSFNEAKYKFVAEHLREFESIKGNVITRGQHATEKRRRAAEALRVRAVSAIQSQYQYMPFSQTELFTYEAVEKHTLKTLFVVELKKYNHLSPKLIRDFQKGKNAIGADEIQVPIDGSQSHLKGFRSILQQAIRYAHCYGAGFVYLTDYEHHILLDTRRIIAALTRTDTIVAESLDAEKQSTARVMNMKIPWYMTDKNNARWLIAWLLKVQGAETLKTFNEALKNDVKAAEHALERKEKEAQKSQV